YRTELLGKPHDRRREQAAEQVNGVPAALLDGLDHGGMIVAERRAHLPGAEVEDLAPVLIVDEGAARLRAEIRRERAAVADHVPGDGFFKPADVAARCCAHQAISFMIAAD